MAYSTCGPDKFQCKFTQATINCPYAPSIPDISSNGAISKVSTRKSISCKDSNKPSYTGLSVWKSSEQILEFHSVEGANEATIFHSMTVLLENIMKQLQMAATIPLLIRDPKILEVLTMAELNIIREVFYQDEMYYSNQTMTTCSSSDSATKRSRPYADSDCLDSTRRKSLTEYDSRTFHAIQILTSYKVLRKLSESYRTQISMTAAVVLHHIQYVFDHTLMRMRMTPDEARAKQLYYRNMWRLHKQSKEDTERLTEELERQRAEHKAQMQTIYDKNKCDTVTVESINKKCAESMRMLTIKRERQQLIAYRVSKKEQHDLETALESAEENLSASRESMSLSEKSIRTKRFKTQSRLQAILRKFDTEIGDRQAQLEELLQIYMADKAEKESLERFFHAFRQRFMPEIQEEEEEDYEQQQLESMD